jgi:ribosomal-protein-alanine N-acetyltransferase
MDGVTLRRAIAEDAAAIATLEPWSEVEIARTLALPTTRAWVALDPGVVGDLIASSAGTGEILLIAVHPQRRRQGIARRLMETLMAAWREEHVSEGFLEVSATNAAAIALYRRYGWTEIGLRRGYYRDGTDALTMRWMP